MLMSEIKVPGNLDYPSKGQRYRARRQLRLHGCFPEPLAVTTAGYLCDSLSYARYQALVDIGYQGNIDVAIFPSYSKRKNIRPNIREQVYYKDSGICYICGTQLDKYDFTVDHFIPLSCGGINDMSNYRCCCKTCNRLKGSMSYGEFMNKIGEIFFRNYGSAILS